MHRQVHGSVPGLDDAGLSGLGGSGEGSGSGRRRLFGANVSVAWPDEDICSRRLDPVLPGGREPAARNIFERPVKREKVGCRTSFEVQNMSGARCKRCLHDTVLSSRLRSQDKPGRATLLHAHEVQCRPLQERRPGSQLTRYSGVVSPSAPFQRLPQTCDLQGPYGRGDWRRRPARGRSPRRR